MHRYPATRHTANFTADLIVESRALREQFREARGRFVLARNEALQRIAEVKAAIANAEEKGPQLPCDRENAVIPSRVP